MTGRGAVTNGLQAALLLARGRSEGLAYVEADLAGAARSFWAAAICLPGFAALRLLEWHDSGAPEPYLHTAALHLVGYVIGWAGFALLSRPLVTWLGRAGRWPRYIAAWNWCNVAQYALMLAACLPELAGAPDWLQQATGLIALGWAVWLEWYATRLVLAVSALVAAGLVAIDVAVGMLVSGIAG